MPARLLNAVGESTLRSRPAAISFASHENLRCAKDIIPHRVGLADLWATPLLAYHARRMPTYWIMGRVKFPFASALKRAVQEIKRAQTIGETKYQKHVPLEPEIRVLERYIALETSGKLEGLNHRPGDAERLERARKAGAKGGSRRTTGQNTTALENLRKAREQRRVIAEGRALGASKEAPAPNRQSVEPMGNVEILKGMIANLQAETDKMKALEPDHRGLIALKLAIQLREAELRKLMQPDSG